jgi:predicted nucleic acid-binding protein
VKGNLVNDTWLAAVAIEGNYPLVSLDKDFSRFPGLRWVNPLDVPAS